MNHNPSVQSTDASQKNRPKPPPIEPWLTDPVFGALYDSVSDRMLVERNSGYMLYQFLKNTAKVAGDVAEVGSYRGGSAKMIAGLAAQSGRRVHVFDTFTGMPATDPERDTYREGAFSNTSFEEVRDYLRPCDNVQIYPGLFPDTADPVRNSVFSLVHIDVDIYRSVLDCCRFFFPRMSIGGVMVFDDYGYIKCPGAKMAVEEFCGTRNIPFFYIPTGQAVIILTQRRI